MGILFCLRGNTFSIVVVTMIKVSMMDWLSFSRAMSDVVLDKRVEVDQTLNILIEVNRPGKEQICRSGPKRH